MGRWLALLLLGTFGFLKAEEFPLQKGEIDPFDRESVRRGAQLFAERCFGCHSLKLLRYRRLQRDLELTDREMRNLFPGMERIHGTVVTGLDPEEGKRWFGAAPPDLSVRARARGADWIYTFLLSFYRDDRRPFGVNNALLEKTAMPHVLWDLEGLKEAILEERGLVKVVKGFTPPEGGKLSPEAYRKLVADVTAFLVYAAEPALLERVPLGKWVLLYLLLLTFVLYRLKKLYWQEIESS